MQIILFIKNHHMKQELFTIDYYYTYLPNPPHGRDMTQGQF